MERRKVLGRPCELSDLHTIKGRVIASDSKRIAIINRELRIKSEKQRQNDAEALIIAKSLIAVV